MIRINYNKYFKLIYAIFLNIAICLLFFFLVPSLYSLPDEHEIASLITDGYYNIAYTNFFLCGFIGLVQNIIYPLNAFVTIHLLLSIISFIAITRVFLDKFSVLCSTCFILFISGFFAINHYVTVSFSHLPSLLTITGFLCIIHYSKREKWIWGTIFGTVLAIIGATYRFMMFEMSCAVAAFFILGKSVSEYYAIEKTKRKILFLLKILFEKKRFIFCIIVLVVSFALNIVSNYINTSTPELEYYKQYTSARSAIWDYPIPDYEVCKSEYDAIDIDENDIAMLRAQYMDDEGAFPIEKLYEIRRIKAANDKVEKPVLQVLKDMVVSEAGNIKALGDKGIASVAGGIVVLFFIILMKKRNYFIPVCLIVITAIDYSYLWIIGRPVFRGIYMTWLGMVVFLLYSLSYDELRDYLKSLYVKRKTVYKTVVAIICVAVSISGFYFSKIGNFTDGNSFTSLKDSALLDYMESNKEKKYEIARGAEFNYNPNNDIYHVNKRNPEQNYLKNVGTYYKLPYYIEVFKDFGTDNYYSNLLNKDVYFVDSADSQDTEMMKKYLQKYYSNGKIVTVNQVDTVSDFFIYKFELV